MAAPDVFEVVDGILTWIEPDPSIAKDEARRRPVTYEPDTLYLYPVSEDHQPYEAAESIRQDFVLRLDVVVDDQGEQAAGVRDPAVTDALRTRVERYTDAVRLHKRTATHDQLRVAGVDWDALHGLGFAGVRLDLAGYRLW